ncbi:MAG: sigma-70 family RNA polymerase sigma factor [Cyclobacteriaceae bacterium]|nr:sigma-70 family RNA polymerase sigma factor [Cyclobacteriaceae bacterium]
MKFVRSTYRDFEPCDRDTLNALWCKIQKGDEKAFDRFYGEMAYNLFGYGMKMIGDEQLVEDCIHDLFLELWGKKDQLQGIKDIKIYVLVSFRRKLLKINRSHSQTFIRESDYANLLANVAHTDGTINEEGEEEDRNYKIRNIIELLSKRQKEVILLRFYHNLTYDKIAEILEIDKRHAHNLASQAFKFIRTHLTLSGIVLLSLMSGSVY